MYCKEKMHTCNSDTDQNDQSTGNVAEKNVLKGNT